MPTLPIDHPVPLIATIGVMLYPGTDDQDRRYAAVYAAHHRSEAYQRFFQDGGELTEESAQLLTSDDELPPDLNKRWLAGVAAGNMMKVLFGLMLEQPELASWNRAAKVVSKANKISGFPSSRAYLWSARTQFLSVAHLWGAFCIREGKFSPRLDVGYSLDADFHCFLHQAEILRLYGRRYHQDRDKAMPFLPDDGWTVPDNWRPPERKPGWPASAGEIEAYTITRQLTAHLKPGGRPRKR